MRPLRAHPALAERQETTHEQDLPAHRQLPTFQQFVDSTFQDEDRGFIVNGDEPATTTGDLRRFYDGMVTDTATPIDGLIVNTVSGRDDKWVPPRP